jgi:hypothetical protein
MSGKVTLFKRGQNGLIQTPSGAHVECVSGHIEVGASDAALMKRCGWKDPPGKAPVKRPQASQMPPPPPPVVPTPEQVISSFQGLLASGTVALLKQIPEPHRQSAVDAGASDWELARAILGNQPGLAPLVNEHIPPYPPGTEEEEGSESEESDEGQNEDGEGDEYSAEDLQKFTVKELLDQFVEEADRPQMSKLKKDDLIAAILGGDEE